jgi:acyl-CoA synthetase (AMP-forming)/AMP-acid ligase II
MLVYAEGEMYRAGTNLYPADIEAHPAGFVDVRGGRVAAFPVATVHGSEGLAIAIEVTSRTRQDTPGLADRVARVVLRQFGVTPDGVLLVSRGTLPSTTRGKLQRHACRRRYEAGTLGEGIAG